MTVMPLVRPFTPHEMQQLRALSSLPVGLYEQLERVQAFLFGEQSAAPMPNAHEYMAVQEAVVQFVNRHPCSCDQCAQVKEGAAAAMRKLGRVMRPALNDAGFKQKNEAETETEAARTIQ